MTTKQAISSFDDLIDIRDVIERVEELEELMPGDASEVMPGTSGELQEIRDELATLTALLKEIAGYGGDEQWRGEWYPVTLVRDTYWNEYAETWFDDVYLHEIPSHLQPYIDYEAFGRDLQMDYSSVEFDGVTYWHR